MLTEFTREFMTSNRGCYSREEMLEVKCVKDNNITLENLFNDLPIKDFCWFLVYKCKLTTEEIQRFALHCAKSVLHIFEKEYPNDKKVRKCLEVSELYLDGKATIEELRIRRKGATVSYYAYTSGYAYSAATNAATNAAHAAASAAYNAAYNATRVAYAAYAASADNFKKTVWNYVTILNNK